MHSYHVSHAGRARRESSRVLETRNKPLGCNRKVGRKAPGRPHRGVPHRKMNHWGHRAWGRPFRNYRLPGPNVSVEIRAEDAATYEKLLLNEVRVADVTRAYSELAPDTELIWIRDSDEGDDGAATQRNLSETDKMFASLNQEMLSEMDGSEWHSVLNMSRSRNDGNDTNQDIESAVQSATDALPPSGKERHPASMPPLPASESARSSLSVRSVTRASDKLKIVVDELQTVRSSVPPVHRRRSKRSQVVLKAAAVSMVVFAVVATVVRIGVFGGENATPVTSASQRQMATALVPNQIVSPSALALAIRPLAGGGPDSSNTAVPTFSMVFTLDEVAAEMSKTGTKTAASPVKRRHNPVNENTSPAEVDASASSLPELPSRKDVEKVMTRISRQVAKCRPDKKGQMVIELTFTGTTGQVTSARMMGRRFRGTSVGQCALQAVRLVRVPKFQNASLVIKYPFEI